MKKRRSRNISLTVLLSTAIGLLIVLSVGTVLVVTAGANFRNTVELLRDSSSLTMSILESRLRAYVDPAEALANHVVQLVDDSVLDVADRSNLRSMLIGMLGSSPQVSGVVIWDRNLDRLTVWKDPDGTINSATSGSEDALGVTAKFSPEQMPDEPTWTTPVFVEDTTYINIQTALYRSEEYVGSFATGIDVGRLSELVKELGGGLEMTAFVLHGDGHVLAHPQLPSLGTSAKLDSNLNLVAIADFPDPVLVQFPSREIDQIGPSDEAFEVESGFVEVGDRQYLFLTKEITGYGATPWTIGVYARLSDVDDQFRRLAGSTGIAFVIFLIAIAAGLLLARYLAKPIIQLSQAAGQVGGLELENIEIPRASFIREINDQISAFNRMVDGLRTFETYIPKALVQRIISQGGSGDVVSTESELTLMFTDIVGFTKMSEAMAPGEVANLLNDHFTIVNECIEAEGGTLDKYIGDAAMAFWGAPDEQADHATRACRAALAIRERMQLANRGKPAEEHLRIKISIHCGPLIVGNIGAPGRINYTVVGDTVNTCSRIEDLCDDADTGHTPATILVSEQVVAATGDAFEFSPIGSFNVKGKSKPLKVFALEGSRGG